MRVFQSIIYSASLVLSSIGSKNISHPIYMKSKGQDLTHNFIKSRINACLKGRESDLSEACIDSISSLREKAKEFKKSLQSDAKKFCQGIKSGGGRIISCLNAHEAELSADCGAFFQKK